MIHKQDRTIADIAELAKNIEKLPHRFGAVEFRVNGYQKGESNE